MTIDEFIDNENPETTVFHFKRMIKQLLDDNDITDPETQATVVRDVMLFFARRISEFEPVDEFVANRVALEKLLYPSEEDRVKHLEGIAKKAFSYTIDVATKIPDGQTQQTYMELVTLLSLYKMQFGEIDVF